VPNATLCDFCYRDLTGKHGETGCSSATTRSCFTCAAYCALLVLIHTLSLFLS
jgi:hypothetical protein